MKILTPKNFKKETDKILSKKQRWHNALDNELCQSVLSNVEHPVFTQGIPVSNQMVTINNILCTLMVIYNPYMVISRGTAIAVCMTDTVSQIVIFVDDDYMYMSKNTQQSIIHHELGHIVCNHNTILGIRRIAQELEADAYAVSIVGKENMINALHELTTYTSRLSRKEIIYRIKTIEKGGVTNVNQRQID